VLFITRELGFGRQARKEEKTKEESMFSSGLSFLS